MYRTCAFCNGKLDGDGGPSGLGVGRRLAFDEWKGRLWVICPKCTRWNLAPLDERLEHVEALARAAGEGRVAAATEQVALIRWRGYDLVRVGRPPRLEFATWRYDERLKARQREQLKFVVPLTVATVGLAVAVNVAAGGSVGVFVWNMPNIARAMYTGIIGRRTVGLIEPPICGRRRARAPHPRRGPAGADASQHRPGAAARPRDRGGRAGGDRSAGAAVEGRRGDRRDRGRPALHHRGAGGRAASVEEPQATGRS